MATKVSRLDSGESLRQEYVSMVKCNGESTAVSYNLEDFFFLKVLLVIILVLFILKQVCVLYFVIRGHLALTKCICAYSYYCHYFGNTHAGLVFFGWLVATQ